MLFIRETSNPTAHKDAALVALRYLELMLTNACQQTRLYVLHIAGSVSAHTVKVYFYPATSEYLNLNKNKNNLYDIK